MTLAIISVLVNYIAFGMMVAYLGKKNFSLLGLMFLMFGFALNLRPLLILVSGEEPSPPYLFSDHFPLLVKANMLLLIWMVSYFLSIDFVAPGAKALSRILPTQPARAGFRGMVIALVLITALAVVVQFVIMSYFGGLGRMINAIKIGKELAGLYFLKYLPGMGLVISAGLIATAMVEKRSTKVVLFLGALYLLNAFVMFSFGERNTIAYTFLSLGVCFFLFNLMSTNKIIILFLAVGSVIYALGEVRYSLARDGRVDNRQFTQIESISNSLHLGEYDSLLLVVRDWKVPEDLRYGTDYYISAVSVVPRLIWPNKPRGVNPGSWFRRIYEPNVVNGWPITGPGEGYINFGWFGPSFNAVLTAFIVATIQAAYWSKNALRPIQLVFSIFLINKALHFGFRTNGFLPLVYYPICLWGYFQLSIFLTKMTDYSIMRRLGRARFKPQIGPQTGVRSNR